PQGLDHPQALKLLAEFRTAVENPVGHMAARAGMPRGETTLWYRRPAEQWDEALPLGNGRLGCGVRRGR
ncbi:hypothetical protein LCGC14_2880930, partial [marine sediment metagenome]